MFKRSGDKKEEPKKIQHIDYNDNSDEYKPEELMSEAPFVPAPPMNQEPVKAAPVSVQQTFTSSAFSIVKDGNSWLVVEIPIDPVTKTTGTWIVHAEDGTKMGAQQRFKIVVAQRLM